MDEKTMGRELDRLVGDPGFLRYHAEQAKRREFNAFDVLRYAEYEIRHSNVLAWLLDPGETHGVGRAFLAWFLGEVYESIAEPGEQRVRVERELHHVDVTIFLESDQDRHIVAIENKPGGYSPEHLAQVCGYAKVLRREYPEYTLHNVLLTTSREAPVLDVAGICGPDVPKPLRVTHVSWSDVGARIKEMHRAGAFAREEVAAFVRQYLVAVGRLIGPEEHDTDYFRKLLSGHRALLGHLSEVLVDDGDDRVGAMVPDRHAHYRGTVVRLVRDFGQEPGRLREEVRQLPRLLPPTRRRRCSLRRVDRGGHGGRTARGGEIPGFGGFGLHAHTRLLQVSGIPACRGCGGGGRGFVLNPGPSTGGAHGGLRTGSGNREFPARMPRPRRTYAIPLRYHNDIFGLPGSGMLATRWAVGPAGSVRNRSHKRYLSPTVTPTYPSGEKVRWDSNGVVPSA